MLDLDKIRKSKNIVEMFEDLTDGKQQLNKIARSVVKGAELDDRSAEGWRKTLDEAMDIAQQIMTKKNFPWEGAANIKYPLITEAAINFAARTYPEIVPNDDIVEVSVEVNDPDNLEYQRGLDVSKCISNQCLSSPDWKEHIDRLLHILPVAGTVFTKIYYSELEKRNCAELIPPDQIIINHDTTTSLKCARRITHILKMSINDIISHQRAGLYCDDYDPEMFRPQGVDVEDNDYEIELYEQHCWLDLDGDNYKEPYIVTVHPETFTILRIVNRIKPGSIQKNSDKDIIQMDAIIYFQDYHCIRSPDGGYYSIGFGQYLLPLNKAINSLMNQLIDAGTVSVTQGGFLGKGLRMKGGEFRFKPFEWKMVDAASGTDLRQNIFPFPVREPSQTLLSLLTLLIDTGKQLTGSTDAVNGDMQASNVANQTYQNLIEQGSKTLKAINKRIYDSMEQAFKKLYELNYYYLTDKEYQKIINKPDVSVKKDFSLDNNNIRPVADPELSTMDQRLKKGSMLMQMAVQTPSGIDPRAIAAYILSAMQFDQNEIKMFMPPPDPNAPPPPEAVKILAEAQLAREKANEVRLNGQLKITNAPLEAAKIQKDMEWIDSQQQESSSRVWKTMKDAAHNDHKVIITGSKMSQQEHLKQIQEQHKQLKDSVDALLRDKQLNIDANNNEMKNSVNMQKIEADKQNDNSKQTTV